LTADARVGHGAALGDHERRHTLVIATAGRGGVVLATAGGRGRAGGGRLRRGVRRHERRRGAGPELELPLGELVEGALVLEEDDLAEALAAERESERHLV